MPVHRIVRLLCEGHVSLHNLGGTSVVLQRLVPFILSLHPQSRFRSQLIPQNTKGMLHSFNPHVKLVHRSLLGGEGGREIEKQLMDTALADEEVGYRVGGGID